MKQWLSAVKIRRAGARFSIMGTVLVSLALLCVQAVFAGALAGDKLPTAATISVDTPLQRAECGPAGLLKSPKLYYSPGWPCPVHRSADRFLFDKYGRDTGAISENVLRESLNERTYSELAPVEVADSLTPAAMPRLSLLVEQCKTHPPLPAIPDVQDAKKTFGLLGQAFDLRLDRLAIRRGQEKVVAQPRDGMELYDLGYAGPTERLYALKAASYAEKNLAELPSMPTVRMTDPRNASLGMLHFFLLPSCRYAGGILYPSRTWVETAFYRSETYVGANQDGTDVVFRKAAPLGGAAHYSAVPISADLIGIASLDNTIIFVTAWPEKISRDVILHRGWVEDLTEALQGGYDPYGRLKADVEDRLNRAGLPFEIFYEEPKYRLELWEIRKLDSQVKIARWWRTMPSEANTDVNSDRSRNTYLRFEPEDPYWKPEDE